MEKALAEDITGLVLAGGRGSRMGGIDKGLAMYRGRPLVATVTERLERQVSEIVVSCNRNHAQYRTHAATVITDVRPGFQGPLAGIESCGSTLRTSMLAVVACDSPALPLDLVARLSRGLRDDNGGVFAHDGDRPQYLFALLRRHSLATLQDYLDAGGRSVKGWYELINATAVDFSDQSKGFTNINRP